MLALTQCWYTRNHVPEGRAHREDDDSYTSHCRHCGRPIISRNRQSWRLAGGFDLTQFEVRKGPRHLSLLDTGDDMVIRRFPIGHLDCEEAVEAFKEKLREEYHADAPDSTIVLRDSAASH